MIVATHAAALRNLKFNNDAVEHARRGFETRIGHPGDHWRPNSLAVFTLCGPVMLNKMATMFFMAGLGFDLWRSNEHRPWHNDDFKVCNVNLLVHRGSPLTP